MNENETAGSIPVITRREQIGALRTREARRGRITGTLQLGFAGLAGGAMLAWLLMILAGILHGSWWHLMPTMGYGTAFLVTGVLFVAGAVAVTVNTYIETRI